MLVDVQITYFLIKLYTCFTFSAQNLFDSCSGFGDALVFHPLQTLALFDIALRQAQQTVIEGIQEQHRTGLVVNKNFPNCKFSKVYLIYINVSIFLCASVYTMTRNAKTMSMPGLMALPTAPETTRETLPRSSDVGRFLSISGW